MKAVTMCYKMNLNTGVVAVFEDYEQWAARNIEAKGWLNKYVISILNRDATQVELEAMVGRTRLHFYRYGMLDELIDDEKRSGVSDEMIEKLKEKLINFKWCNKSFRGASDPAESE